MGRRDSLSRRRFLKTAAFGAVAAAAGPAIFIPRRVEAYQPGAAVHPNIDRLRVAGLQDAAMTTGGSIPATWAEQEACVIWEPVQANMDKLACALAGESSPADAWKSILVKPAGKPWGDVTVAIKTNHIAEQHTRSAVMSKLCHMLTGVMGVKPGNIVIYDACHGRDLAGSTPFAQLPDGVTIANQWGGSDTDVSIPAPYQGGTRQAGCVSHLARGEVDILIDLALCKGHGGEFGTFTMCMKNHFGTFSPRPAHDAGGGADYMIGINKTPEILGEMDPITGNVLFPRQQLCIVDALWSSEPGPQGPPTAQTNALFMGTFGPAMDYMVATRFRRDAMGWRVNTGVTDRIAQEFGFAETDLPNGGQIIDALAV